MNLREDFTRSHVVYYFKCALEWKGVRERNIQRSGGHGEAPQQRCAAPTSRTPRRKPAAGAERASCHRPADSLGPWLLPKQTWRRPPDSAGQRLSTVWICGPEAASSNARDHSLPSLAKTTAAVGCHSGRGARYRTPAAPSPPWLALLDQCHPQVEKQVNTPLQLMRN
uniref:Uncharacterized protein n=1 Tax=Molossus molossus TaxID=27622 RepID=A0A7J8F959_MOLMO|nr:hypothetical protein HJG59_008510 [Molossus molossus]